MASSSRRFQPNVSRPLPENPQRFFKVVLPSALREKKLRIPQKFVEKFGHELSEVATLSVPNGRPWQVKLKKKGKKIWFHSGWQDFVESLSISAGYFLVFKYVKNSSFRVFIFDFTACEIDYPYDVEESIADKQNSEFQDDKGNESSEECVEISEGQLKQECEQQNKKRKMEDAVEIDEPNRDDESDLLSFLMPMKIYITEKYQLLSAEESERAMNIARTFKPKNPSFMVIWKPHGQVCREVYVPAKFAEQFVKKDAKYVQIQTCDKRIKSVNICWRTKGGFYLTRGWAGISKGKNLKEGDFLVFELVGKQDILLKLSVFRGT